MSEFDGLYRKAKWQAFLATSYFASLMVVGFFFYENVPAVLYEYSHVLGWVPVLLSIVYTSMKNSKVIIPLSILVIAFGAWALFPATMIATNPGHPQNILMGVGQGALLVFPWFYPLFVVPTAIERYKKQTATER